MRGRVAIARPRTHDRLTATALRIAPLRDPGAQSATAPNPPVAPIATVHGAKASRADARRPPFEGKQNV